MHTARVFQCGRSQAIRLPKEYRFTGDEVCVTRVGRAVVLFEPGDRRQILLDCLGKATDDFMVERNQPA